MSTTTTLPAWQLSDRDLTTRLLTTQRQQNVAYAAQLETIRELESRGAVPEGYSSTSAYLATILHVTLREARARLAQATGTLPLTWKALSAGEITAQHATVIAEFLADAPRWLTPEDYTVAEDTLVTLAGQANPSIVRRAATRLKIYWDNDPSDVSGSSSEASPGSPDVDHGLDPDSVPDPSSGSGSGSGSGFRSGSGSDAAARPWREFSWHWTRTGRFRFAGNVDHETGTLIEQLLVPLAAPDPATTPDTPDPRTPAERHGDAIAAIVDLAARTPDLPAKAGERAVATVTVSLETLQSAAKTIFTDDESVLPASHLRRILCDAKVYPAVLGTEGQVLDLGRSARTATNAQRRALAIRDRGCTFPGCDRGPKWTTPHHIVHWAHGGATDLDNLASCCERHHRLLHHSGWKIVLRDGAVYWIPPSILDPEQKPLRNTAHNPPPAPLRTAAAATSATPPRARRAS
ncbi:HNH endonuclease signature motif containing protein [Amycolatopsis echigonensis]|uniref:HNH endonuclease signature motif containing protein n=1 Tax=Amycolatopsis echigonensis TaxID=2576905 RepID=UPI001C805402|nr:HNH endonuclease signature motif containing protein [Amycolatopsis echigonensis]